MITPDVMTKEVWISWIVLCFIAGAMGSKRNIGFWPSFFLSIILSPLIGFIIVLFSKRKDRVITVNNVVNSSTAEEIKKYKELMEEGIITKEEFERKKSILIK